MRDPNLDIDFQSLRARALSEEQFVAWGVTALAPLGFTADNTIAAAAVCRDEISQPLIRKIHAAWGEAFNLASLGGMFFAGKTAISAAMHHSPNSEGRERYVFFSIAHIATDSEGHVGVTWRPGRAQESSACGALCAFHAELRAGLRSSEFDPDDIEQSLLRQRLLAELPDTSPPDLLRLTLVAQAAGQVDLERAIAALLHPEQADLAIFGGLQIHTPRGDLLTPLACHAMVRGQRIELDPPRHG